MTTNNFPPDFDGLNPSRAEWAQAALDTFAEITGTDAEDALSDLLCDLLHLCDRKPELGGFDLQLARARAHYTAETMPIDGL